MQWGQSSFKEWDSEKKSAEIIMLYPSSADTVTVDHTTMFVLRNLERLNYGSVNIVNLFSSMSGKHSTSDIDEDNIGYIQQYAESSDIIIFATGTGGDGNKTVLSMQKKVLDVLEPYANKPMDKGLIDRTKQEKAGILNWALTGLYRLMSNNWNMTENPKIRSLTTKYYSQSNPVSNFVCDCVEEHTDSRIRTSVVYECFMRWARKSKINVLGFENRKKFRELFLKACADTDLPVSVVKNSVEFYCGINLTKDCMVNTDRGTGHDKI